jgi:hypothetical protein
MKFKDLDEKTIFTWWGSDHLHTGVKIGDGRAFCFDTLEIIAIHANRDVKEPEPIPEDVILKFGRTGQAFLCSPLPGGKMLARRVLLIGGEIMNEENLKAAQTPHTGGEKTDENEVYIMWKMAEKKLADLEKLMSVVGMMLEEGLSQSTSDNDLMLPRTFIKGRALTE